MFEVGVTHIFALLQQPLHTVPPQEHAPFEHDSLAPQDAQAAPPVPHALPLCVESGMQCPVESQQPLAQLLGPHFPASPESPGASLVGESVVWASPPPPSIVASPLPPSFAPGPLAKSPRRLVQPDTGRSTTARRIARAATANVLMPKTMLFQWWRMSKEEPPTPRGERAASIVVG
jgi:hypothetical protein